MKLRHATRLLVLAGFGCSEVDDQHRAAFVQQVLVDDNRVWLYRNAPGVADKFAVMSADRYNFMRGAAALHFADLARPVDRGAATAFLNAPQATSVLIFGDPHPENATVCRPDPTAADPEPSLSIEYVDLDAAGYGPWTLDLRRAALGHATMLADLPGCDSVCVDDAVLAMVSGYMSGLAPDAVVSVAAKGDGAGSDFGAWLTDLFDEAVEEGEAQKKTHKYAPVGEDGTRALLLGPDTGLEALTADEARVLDLIVRELPLPEGFRLLDAARRFGSGVSSQAAMRFVVVWDRGDDGPEDDALLQVREVIDPPAFPGRPYQNAGVFEDNHSRVVSTSAQLWSRPDADPRHVGGLVDGLSWKGVSWTSYFQDVEHGKVLEAWAEDDIDAVDLAELGFDLGRVLAASHARTRTIDGLDARTVIEDDIAAGGGESVLRDEVLDHVHSDLTRLHSDFELFGELLQTEGPLLGADRLLDGVEP